eukprot:Hpha_TRINITY_DN12020_c0_g1::TRINITY_DN12020_c0_g1_i1::g.140896::m.140896
MGKRLLRSFTGGQLAILACTLVTFVLRGEPSARQPGWVKTLQLPEHIDQQSDDRIRQVLTKSGVDEDQFWTMKRDELSLVFANERDANVVSHVIATTARPDSNSSSGCIPGAEAHPDYACFTGSLINACYPLMICLSTVLFVQFLRVDRQEMNHLSIASVSMEPAPNVYRAVAILTRKETEETGASPTWVYVMTILTAWTQSYLPYRMYVSHRENNPLYLVGLKTVEYFGYEWTRILEEVSSILVIGLMIVRNIQTTTLDEAVRCHRIICLNHIPGAFGRGKCWILFFCFMSLTTTLMSGFFLSLYMMSTIATTTGDISVFVMNTMKIVFFLSIDEMVFGAIDFDDGLQEKYGEVISRVAEAHHGNDVVRSASKRHGKVFQTAMEIWYALLELVAFGGLLVLLLTYWVNPSGVAEGI